jgi:hypothetical protein
MIWQRKLIVGIIVFFVFSSLSVAYCLPSGGVYPPEFTLIYGEWYDSWGFNRNYYGGSDGFIPNVAYESLGTDKELAYSIGEWFRTNYPQKVERAEAVLAYVQRWTDYGYDVDNVYMNDIPQDEWAWNADELAHKFDENTNSVAIGDCEDMSFLCSTIYLAAGFDVALVSPPEHVALLIWLPEYDNANYYWDIPNDGREHGWIWVEATGEENPLGWTPPDFADGDWISYPLGFSEFNVEFSPQHPQAEDDVTVRASIVSARGTINQVLLNYSIGNVNEVIQMVAEGSTFEAVIPKQPDRTRVVCTVSAIDTDGFAWESKFEYVVGQNIQIPPLLLETAVVFFVVIIITALLIRSKALLNV